MFESIEQLEKEVKDFQKNILASSELIKSIESLITATKAQKEDFSATSSELASKMDSHTEALRKSYEEALAKLVKENRSLIKELIVRGDELLQEMKAIPSDVQKRNSALSVEIQAEKEAFFARCDELLQSVSTNSKTHHANVVETLNTAQQAYIQSIEEADVSIKNCEAEINRKYKDFLIKLESTNVDQMFKMCQDIKKSMDTKLLLLSVGVGASLILMIVSIFIR
jgi:chromosome segregation ATPase